MHHDLLELGRDLLFRHVGVVEERVQRGAAGEVGGERGDWERAVRPEGGGAEDKLLLSFWVSGDKSVNILVTQKEIDEIKVVCESLGVYSQVPGSVHKAIREFNELKLVEKEKRKKEKEKEGGEDVEKKPESAV